MPALIKYERKPMTMAQLCAVRDYIVRKRIRQDFAENGDKTGIEDAENPVKQDGVDKNSETREEIIAPPAKTAKQIRAEKQERLKSISEELIELEKTLEALKDKKHSLFEKLRNLLSTEKQNKRQAEEKERQLHGFGQPFMNQATAPAVVVATTSPFRGITGVKRPKSPSPPLVQLYSPSRTNSQHDVSQSSPGLPRPRHPLPAHNSFGDAQRPPFQPMNTKIAGHSDNTLPGYQFQQNLPRDGRHAVSGTQMNPRAPTSPQPPHYTTQERQFAEQRHVPPSFNHPQNSTLALPGNTGHSLPLQNQSRQPTINQNPFLQQNMIPGQQQGASSNSSDVLGGSFGQFGKDHPGFNNAALHCPQSQMKRGNHTPNRSARFY